jgi:predicted transcriptional regulator
MKRTTLYLDENLIQKVKEIAESQKRSVSFMVSVLLEYAIREKQRKKKNHS